MADSSHNRILVAVDSSEHAVEMMHYAGKTIPKNSSHVVLFHVVASLPEAFHDFDKESEYNYRIINTDVWKSKQLEEVERFMSRARQIFLDAGFTPDSISMATPLRKVGIAQDVIEESQKGYDAVVVGRKGLSQLKDLVMGSIATRLVEKLADVPVWIVGGRSQRGRILVCLDKSEGSLQAVDHVGHLLGNSSSDFRITLFHVLTDSETSPFGFTEYLGDHELRWVEEIKKRIREDELAIESAMGEAKERLVKAGFEPQKIDRKIVRGGGKQAGAIAEEAQKGEYDTIVVGRRGLSKVQEFIMGRVSNKVINLAKDKTVWVVG